VIARFVGGPWDGQQEERNDRPAFVVKTDEDTVVLEETTAGEVYLYRDVGDAADGAILFEVAGRRPG
jgi:hypothetical protein